MGGHFRGSGVLEKISGVWKISHYVLSVLVYNEIWEGVMGLITEDENPEIISDLSAPVMDEPTFENKLCFENTVDHILDKFPKLDICLSGLDFGKNSFNDQVLLAMKIAKDI